MSMDKDEALRRIQEFADENLPVPDPLPRDEALRKIQEFADENLPEFRKAEQACEAFGCVPYFACVIDENNLVRLFLLPLSRLIEVHKPGKKVAVWKMGPKWLERYRDDPAIKIVEFSGEVISW